MSKQSKELNKAYTKVISDIFDNFDKYSPDEKKQVHTELGHLENLNAILEKYDKKRKNFFEIIAELFNNATGKK